MKVHRIATKSQGATPVSGVDASVAASSTGPAHLPLLRHGRNPAQTFPDRCAAPAKQLLAGEVEDAHLTIGKTLQSRLLHLAELLQSPRALRC